MEQYNGWPIYETMPDGYWIDKNAGSPLHGYEFIINGSPLKGGKRALLRVDPHSLSEYIKELNTLTSSMGCDKRADISDDAKIQGELF